RKIIEKAFLDGYGGNEMTILRVHDAIRNYNINTFDFINNIKNGDLIRNHSLKREQDSFLEDEPLYVIRFKKIMNSHTAMGRLYISKVDFSIYKLDYAVYDDSTPSKSSLPDRNGYKNKLMFEVSTQYLKKDEKMYLNYISFHNEFKVTEPPKFVISTIELKFSGNKLETVSPEILGVKINVKFNNDIKWIDGKHIQKREIVLNGQKVDLERIIILDNQLVLHPYLTEKEKKFWEQIWRTRKMGATTVSQDNWDFDIDTLEDIDGNILDTWTTKEYNQFREFFVQNIDFKPKAYPDSLLMDKRKPIFGDQPISKPDTFEEYWMNTPLKKHSKLKKRLGFIQGVFCNIGNNVLTL
ncbi:MAG: hypothetical protein WA810_10975, partial [Maribacter sp.]